MKIQLGHNKMTSAFLVEPITGRRHDLTALLQQNNKVITIGRDGKGALIELGQGIVIEREKTQEKTEEIGIAKIKALHALVTVSGKHATITYELKRDYEAFFIKDHSRNGTWINGVRLSGEKGRLKNRDVLRFGTGYYAIFEYEESN
jgi:pSer/pThr/pTyr-binding forkhead associated (FHA) protein